MRFVAFMHSPTTRGQVKAQCAIAIDLADLGGGRRSATQLQYEVAWREAEEAGGAGGGEGGDADPLLEQDGAPGGGMVTKTLVVVQQEDYFDPEAGLLHQAW